MKEIWVLRRPDGALVPPIDDDGTNVFLAWPSREQAERGREKQANYFAEILAVERLFPEAPCQ